MEDSMSDISDDERELIENDPKLKELRDVETGSKEQILTQQPVPSEGGRS